MNRDGPREFLWVFALSQGEMWEVGFSPLPKGEG